MTDLDDCWVAAVLATGRIIIRGAIWYEVNPFRERTTKICILGSHHSRHPEQPGMCPDFLLRVDFETHGQPAWDKLNELDPSISIWRPANEAHYNSLLLGILRRWQEEHLPEQWMMRRNAVAWSFRRTEPGQPYEPEEDLLPRRSTDLHFMLECARCAAVLGCRTRLMRGDDHHDAVSRTSSRFSDFIEARFRPHYPRYASHT